MEALQRLRWAFNKRNAMWAIGYLLLVELRPCVQQKIERLLEMAPTDLVLGAFGLIGLYILLLPKQSRDQLTDLWQGGDARLHARMAIKKLREEIEKYSSLAAEQSRSACLTASIAACTALMLFQASSYEEAAQTASLALQSLESHMTEQAARE